MRFCRLNQLSVALLRGLMFLGLLQAVSFTAEAAPKAQHVFIISIDGGKPAVIRESEMPTLKRMAAEGACTWTAQTIYPSITLPSHTSMLTGVGPKKHQILWNTWKPEAGCVKVPTVFSEAKRAGFSTAMIVGKEKFRTLMQPGTVDYFDYPSAEETIVYKPVWFGLFKTKSTTVLAKTVAADAAAYIKEHKPNLCFIHFTDPDDFGHHYGWGSPEQRKAFANVDAALAEVVRAISDAGLLDESVVIVTADHGGHSTTHGSRRPAYMNIPWIVWGKDVKRDYSISEPVSTCDTAATALWLLGVTRPGSLDGKPVASAFTLPKRNPIHTVSATKYSKALPR